MKYEIDPIREQARRKATKIGAWAYSSMGQGGMNESLLNKPSKPVVSDPNKIPEVKLPETIKGPEVIWTTHGKG